MSWLTFISITCEQKTWQNQQIGYKMAEKKYLRKKVWHLFVNKQNQSKLNGQMGQFQANYTSVNLSYMYNA